ncbi:efflux RND transporter periplasmic adaptor subunit [Candidatus Peregrinibacteria bacterium]|nr:efflux RND transporter periplasmic adaptor subunit [Candidatus Peregrinibacteria bacterium]
MKKTFILSLIISITFSGCSLWSTKDSDTDLIDRGIPDKLKEIEIYDLGTEKPEITITSSGFIASDTEVNIAPQIVGKISEIHAQVGDFVQKDDLLVTLGDSLSTDLLQLQYETASQSLDLSDYATYLTDFSSEQSLDQADLSVQIAEENYYNAIQARNNAEEQYETQLESLELQLENAEDLAEKAINQTDYPVDQADVAIEILEASHQAQIDQLNYAIEIAYLQCLAALNQLEMQSATTELQKLQAQTQLLQADSSQNAAEKNYQQRYIRAPQNGTLTAITVKKGNLVAPGQIIIQIQDTDSINAKTAISKEESRFIDLSTKVYVDTDEGEQEGKITFLSPSLNPLSKKIDLEIALQEESETLPGSFTKIYFKPKADDLIIIPLNTIFIEKGDKFVKIVNGENKIEHRKIRIKEVIGDFAIVKSGLNGNEKVVSNVEIFTQEGEEVSIKNS